MRIVISVGLVLMLAACSGSATVAPATAVSLACFAAIAQDVQTAVTQGGSNMTKAINSALAASGAIASPTCTTAEATVAAIAAPSSP